MVNILELQTTQTNHIRTLIDTLNSLLTDVNITFLPYYINGDTTTSDENKKVGGVVIKELNKTSSILIHCKLDADQFHEYKYNYKYNKLTIGINIGNFLKCIKCMTHFDTMTWIVDDEDINKLIMILESEKEKKTFKINLMDLEENDYEIDPISFPYYMNLSCQDFQRYCKDMAQQTDKMEIKCTSNIAWLSGKGETGVFEIELDTAKGAITIHSTNNNNNEIVQGLFELKYLNMFTRCTSLCEQVTLFLKNNYPLIVKYSVATLGEIRLVLSQSKPKTLY